MVFDIAHIVLAAGCAILCIMYQIERCRAEKRETNLIKALLSDSAQEYADSHNTVKERIKEIKAESKLAEKAWKLQQSDKPTGGVPVI
jgi:flagella basal body P-ring formation protein FlgA